MQIDCAEKIGEVKTMSKLCYHVFGDKGMQLTALNIMMLTIMTVMAYTTFFIE